MIKIVIESDQIVRSINIDFESGEINTDPASAGATVSHGTSSDFTTEHPVMKDDWEEPMEFAPIKDSPEGGNIRKASPVGENLNVDTSAFTARKTPSVVPSIEIPDVENRDAPASCGIEDEEL